VLGGEPDVRDARRAVSLALTDPARLTPLLDRLDPSVVELLDDLLLLGGAITAADLDGLAQRMGRPASAAHASASVLERHGLLFPLVGTAGPSSMGGPTSWRRIAGWRVPPEIRDALAPLQPLARFAPDADGSSTHPGSKPTLRFARVRRASPRPLCLTLALLARAPEPYRVASTSRPVREAVPSGPLRSRPRPLPLVAGEIDPATLAELARGAGVAPGLARLARRVLLWSRESASVAALADLGSVPARERALVLRAGFRLWATADTPAELADLQLPDAPVRLHIAPEHAAWHPGALAQEAAEARAFVLRLLGQLRPGEWRSLESILDQLWRLNPLFLRGRQAAFSEPAWWLERPGEHRPLRPRVHEEWQSGEGEYVRALLAGPLHWWGALDLGLDAAGTLGAVRLTSFGRFLFGQADTPADADAPLLQETRAAPVLPTREGALAVHPLAANAGLFDALASWASVTAIAGGRVVYTLSPERACAAWDAGASADGVLARLRALDSSGRARLAVPVAARLAAWRERYGRTRITIGWALLEARDEATLVEALAAVPAIASGCKRLGTAAALVPPPDLLALRQALARRDFTV
jgi:hypothetical protein